MNRYILALILAATLCGVPAQLRAQQAYSLTGAYNAANAPTGAVFKEEVANVSFTSTGTTSVFTVPAGKTYVCIGAYAVLTTVTGFNAATAPQWRIDESTGPSAMTSTATSSTSVWNAVGKVASSFININSGAGTPAGAGSTVRVNVTVANTSTALVGTVYLIGFYY